MNIIVTCGPSYEPIDQVRRITNFSTGRLGITLANAITAAGHRVHCFKGDQATDPTPIKGEVISFSTNDNLSKKLEQLAGEPIDAIFHAAALCDFKVAPDATQTAKKISTKDGDLILRLEPTIKVLPKLRGWFPSANIVGWKYELDGNKESAVEKAFSQIQNSETNACVVNGGAYGTGFGFCEADKVRHLPDLESLCAFLLSWTTGRQRRKVPPL